MNSSIYCCTLHGSYTKNLELITHIADLFDLVGVQILAPKSLIKKVTKNGFVVFDNDNGEPEDIEKDFLRTINSQKHDPRYFAYFINPNGYIGPSTSFELSLIINCNINYYALCQPSNIPIRLLQRDIKRPKEVVGQLLNITTI